HSARIRRSLMLVRHAVVPTEADVRGRMAWCDGDDFVQRGDRVGVDSKATVCQGEKLERRYRVRREIGRALVLNDRRPIVFATKELVSSTEEPFRRRISVAGGCRAPGMRSPRVPGRCASRVAAWICVWHFE